MSCQQVPTAPAFNPYPRSVQVGEFEVAISGGIWVAIGGFPLDFFDFALKILDFTRFNRHLSRSKLNWRVRNEESEIPG